MPPYSLAFLPSARREWDKLGATIAAEFKARLVERLEAPHVATARLAGMPGCYKIKLRGAGYRLVYRVDDAVVVVTVVAIGKRDRNAVYKLALGRLD